MAAEHLGASESATVDHLLGELERLVEPALSEVGSTAAEIVVHARIAASGVTGRDARFLAAVSFVADVLVSLAAEERVRERDLAAILGDAARAAGIDRQTLTAAVASRALRDPGILGLPPSLALDVVLRLLAALAPVAEVSLWMKDADGRLRRLTGVGRRSSVRRVRASAREALTQGHDPVRGPFRDVSAFPVVRWGHPIAAVVVRGNSAESTRAAAAVREALGPLSAIIELSELLERNGARERALVETGERRLARLAFDVHDGPVQTMVAIASDLRLFSQQLMNLFPSSHGRTITLGRVADIQARLVALEQELRTVAHAAEPNNLLHKSLREALHDQVSAFVGDDMTVDLSVGGEVPSMSASQRIAHARVVQEAIFNARSHGAATRVGIVVEASERGISTEIQDNGSGFDVERTLVEAARKGRLGLIGMGERVRLLGGSFDVRSRPGGPTVVHFALPAWQPIADHNSIERDHSAIPDRAAR